MDYLVWNLSDRIDVMGRFTQITFAKNIHGFTTDIISANFDTDANIHTVEKMRKRADDRIKYENERLASR